MLVDVREAQLIGSIPLYAIRTWGPPYFVLRLELEQIEPVIWRIVRVPGDLRLAALHGVLQSSLMGWHEPLHAHGFELRGRSDEDRTVGQALALCPSGFTYLYDVDGGWRVRITRAPGVWRLVSKAPIACLDGYLAGPCDDSGGPKRDTRRFLPRRWGRRPRLSAAAMERLGRNFDPEAFDRTAINRELALLHRE